MNFCARAITSNRRKRNDLLQLLISHEQFNLTGILHVYFSDIHRSITQDNISRMSKLNVQSKEKHTFSLWLSLIEQRNKVCQCLVRYVAVRTVAHRAKHFGHSTDLISDGTELNLVINTLDVLLSLYLQNKVPKAIMINK